MLMLDKFSVLRGGTTVIKPLSLTVDAGELVGIIGPNGAGKTTLLRAALGLIPYQGVSDVGGMSHKERAKHVSWMPQTREVAWPIPVRRLVELGRMPYHTLNAKIGDVDRRVIDRVLTLTELNDLASRPATELSGGEQARMLLARVLVQDTPLIMADEPIAGLDPAHQIKIMENFKTITENERSVITSLHDLTLTARYSTRVILMKNGQITADGPPKNTMTKEALFSLFGIDFDVFESKNGLIVQSVGPAVKQDGAL